MNLPENYQHLAAAELQQRLVKAKSDLKDKALILAHHYQRDEVWEMADHVGDSLALARIGAENKEIPYIVFCGVHFMAETADILASPDQIITLPDIEAGCPLADSAEPSAVLAAWEKLEALNLAQDFTPITYVNSAASLKSFCGENNGIVCTSGNAEQVMRWAYKQTEKVFFFPDKNLGTYTGKKLGIKEAEIYLWNPMFGPVGQDENKLREAKLIVWGGFCPVHTPFSKEDVEDLREQGFRIIAHPECEQEVTENADLVGSTSFIIKEIGKAAAGTKWAVGTEVHLVNRLRTQHPDQEITLLSQAQTCMCANMDRISPEHLLWNLEELVRGKVVNRVQVEEKIKAAAKKALERMLGT
ncbi:MAG: quinolinate synthase NadA [Candidatus Gracilibacteria bacterium]|nr:quinolinate synthase NadA [Candidatus Gracilibacteria bacterium]